MHDDIPRPRHGLRGLLALALWQLATLACSMPPADDATSTDARSELADTLDRHLRSVLSKWYPRCVDRERGGFLEHFGPDWSSLPETGKFLVYQARMTWVAAEVAGYAPDLREEYIGYARHGLRFLNETMRDRENGGVHFRLGRDLKPIPPGDKHAYGLSFAIYAGAAVFRETREPTALDLARHTFEWLDRRAHDSENGGYFEALTVEGRPILDDPGRRTDGIGTFIGYKSMNSHIHLLEAFTALYRVWPDAKLRARLEELLAVVRDKVAVEPGCLNLFFTPDWRPVPAHDSFGHDIETAFLLVEAADALGRHDDAPTHSMARKLVDHALEWGYDTEHGGFFEKGEAFAPAHDRTKVWWTQAEGLNALLLMHELHGREDPRYLEAFQRQWRFIQEHQVDPVHGGWHGHLSREGVPLGDDHKASPWKAAYHNVRALVNCALMLRGQGASHAPR